MEGSVLQRYGEHLLKAAGKEFTTVDKVDFNYEYYRGWSEYTPADWDYEVEVFYDGDKHFAKTFWNNGLPEIIRGLEAAAVELENEIMEKAYE